MKIFILIVTLLTTLNISAGDYAEGLNNPQTQLKTLNEILEFGEDADVNVKTLLKLLKEDNKDIAALSFKVVLIVGSDEEIEKAIKLAVKSKHKNIVSNAIKKLKLLKDRELISNIVIALLDSDNKFVRENAVTVAGDLKLKKTTDKLIKMLLDTYVTQHIVINKMAARALGKIGDKKAIPALIKGLFIKKDFKGTNNKGRVFNYARDSLVLFGKDALKEIIKVLSNNNEDFNSFVRLIKLKPSDVRYNLILMIKELGNKSDYHILKKYLNDEDSGIRILVIDTLGEYGVKKAVSILIKKYKKLKKNVKKEFDNMVIMDKFNEMTKINNSLAKIGGKTAHKHLVREILAKSLVINKKKYNNLKENTADLFLNFAPYKYYKVYKKIYKKERNKDRKAILKKYLKIMVVSKCKNKIKCYKKYIDNKKNIKNKELYDLRKEKAVYMLVNFKKGKKRKRVLDLIFKNILLSDNDAVQIAGIFVLKRLIKKSYVPEMEKFIKKIENDKNFKGMIPVYKNMIIKLKNR